MEVGGAARKSGKGAAILLNVWKTEGQGVLWQ